MTITGLKKRKQILSDLIKHKEYKIEVILNDKRTSKNKNKLCVTSYNLEKIIKARDKLSNKIFSIKEKKNNRMKKIKSNNLNHGNITKKYKIQSNKNE